MSYTAGPAGTASTAGPASTAGLASTAGPATTGLLLLVLDRMQVGGICVYLQVSVERFGGRKPCG